MKETVDFLRATTDSIRHSIRDIDDSYNNFWDIFAELAQNAVDAIIEAKRPGRIEIKVDCRTRSVCFKDNGCGIAAERIPHLLNLFSSGKVTSFDTIGEKGVGLKFVLFQSSKFIMTTSNGVTAARATVIDANTWKNQQSDSMLQLELEELSDVSEPGTSIEVYGVEAAKDEDVFGCTKEQLVFLLRTKTALGSTRPLWDADVSPIDITLEMTDINGGTHECQIENRYWLPTEGLNQRNIVTLDQFNEWCTSSKDDAQKRKYLQGKILVDCCEELKHNGRKMRYWACFVPSRGVWDALNEKVGIATRENLDSNEWLDTWSSLLLKPEITVATKGMPTSIQITPPSVGYAGYLPNFFIIFEDDNLRFDIGRKSLRGKTSNVYREEARDVFNRFSALARYSAGQTSVSPSAFNREASADEAKSLPDLNSEKISFAKLPNGQEASVIAIFFELLGKGEVKGIVPLSLKYQNRYDLIARYNDRTVFIEFKAALCNIVKDFSDFSKIFDEMDYLVCWDVTDDDILKLKKAGIDVDEYEPSTLCGPTGVPDCVTHTLYISNVNPVYVIDIKRLV
ncbi:ATP-binding protein [Adlercreutzia sp. R21]|uniref:ATP-binding protein n=1 Tax=Adlercreutzia wanghongyangiae TaxID=3111451 RepID=UPI002DB6D053|nr:ATP-binding protein [Adlercreutzia sp. R21]MEC4185316.1 ATP-binding protein [Adlercreutzia sp. R21]